MQKAGVSRRTPVREKHPMLNRKGEMYRDHQAALEEMDVTGTVSSRTGSPRPHSANPRLQSPTKQRAAAKQAKKQAKPKGRARAGAGAAAAAQMKLKASEPLGETRTNRNRGSRPQSAPHRHTMMLEAKALKHRRAQRQANAGRIAIFAGVNLATAMAALQQSKDDVAVATQMIMRDKLRRMGGVYDKARRKDAAAPATEEVTWRSKAGDQRRHRSTTTAATAVAARSAAEQKSGAWMAVGLHCTLLEQTSLSNDHKQLSR